MLHVDLKRIISRFDLEILVKPPETTKISVSDINRPGLELAGFFDYFAYERIQILGKTEISFIKSLPYKTKVERLETFFDYNIPCVIITRDLKPPKMLIDIAKRQGKWVLRTSRATTSFISRLTEFMESMLAPAITIHGVLVDVYGIGILILGESGIGKSETALELIKRGHRLIADDIVEIKQVSKNVLVGTAPEISRYYLEVRGLGIINVKTIFGMGAVRDNIKIEMVTEMIEWDNYENSDRLGLKEEKMEILDSNISKKTIPVRPGRNLAVILEVAAMDHKLRVLGYNAGMEFSKRVEGKILKKNKE